MTPIDQLRTCPEEKLPLEIREAVLALGSSAVAPLIEILLEEDLASDDSPDEGWASIHAAELLVDLKAGEAIEPMLRVLVETNYDVVIHDLLLRRLPELGAAVLEPALRHLEDTDDEDVADSLVVVLANLGVLDERVFDAIRDVFEEDVVSGAADFADYGDARALPWIEDAIAQFEPDFSETFWRFDLTELLEAYERLGGILGDALQARIEGIDEAWKQRAARSARTGGAKVGRNDPCPCGSGKKYKKCCLEKASTRDNVDVPARKLIEFAKPLLDATDGSDVEVRRTLVIARVLWQAAVAGGTECEDILHDLLRTFPEADRGIFEAVARGMIREHGDLFPEAHEPVTLAAFRP
jgi:hypothetical protein